MYELGRILNKILETYNHLYLRLHCCQLRSLYSNIWRHSPLLCLSNFKNLISTMKYVFIIASAGALLMVYCIPWGLCMGHTHDSLIINVLRYCAVMSEWFGSVIVGAIIASRKDNKAESRHTVVIPQTITRQTYRDEGSS